MKIKFGFLVTFLLFLTNSYAQSSLQGQLTNQDQEPIIGANVVLMQLSGKDTLFYKGISSELDGSFLLKELDNGAFLLRISHLSHQQYEQRIMLQNQTLNVGKIELQSAVAELVTTEVRSQENLFANEAASTITIKTIVRPSFLEKITSPTNLVEALQMTSGVQENVACGVCFTNSISINGLAGQYTAILIDGMPMYGNLASVYGLNGIPVNMIDRIEVVKGPNSTLYGSEAVAGVINIITKSADQQPLLAIDVMATTHAESFVNLMVAPRLGKKWNAILGVQHAYVGEYQDQNADGFGDFVNMDRVSIFIKFSMKRPNNRTFNILGKYYYEDRRNGVEKFMYNRNYRALRGSDSIYGESIYTQRGELMGSYQFPTKELLRVDFSSSYHHQNSYYGNKFYDATQMIGFSNFVWTKFLKRHGLMAGATLRYQYYDDNTIATQDSLQHNKPTNQAIIGLFGQDMWEISDKFSFLYGARLDYYQTHGLIPAPRLSMRWKPSNWTMFRLNLGTGFRVVNLFSEDHAFITGNRTLEIQGNLHPERSYNATFNFNHVFTMGKSQGTLDIDLFYTYFTNAIIPDYSESNKIIYKNLKGNAQTRGINLSYNQQWMFPLSFSLNFNAQYASQMIVKEIEQTKETKPLPFAPFWSGNWTIFYEWRKINLSVAYSGRVIGNMALPLVYDVDNQGTIQTQARPTMSKPYSMHNFQITKTFKKWNGSLYIGIQNINNFRQPVSPLVGYNDPNFSAGFSPYFDTAYAYAPSQGREFYFGVRWKLAKRKK